jgi:hypothetical protein
MSEGNQDAYNQDAYAKKDDPDVEGHSADNVETVDAQEEPPDVEGHNFDNVENVE